MSGFLHDLRTAARHLRKAPGFTAAAVLMLALGIGATVAIFSIVNGILLRPLPFPHADRLVAISDKVQGAPGIGGDFSTAQDIENESRDTHSFASLGGWQDAAFTLNGEGLSPQNILAARLTSGIFPTLGVAPMLGRVFTAQEDSGYAQVAVISYGLWHDRFQSNPAILGHKILLNLKPYIVIGVMPRSFSFPLEADMANCRLWVPMSFEPQELSPAAAASWNYTVVARLKPGVTYAQARADLNAVDRDTMKQYPPYMSAFHITPVIKSLHAETVNTARPLLHLLFLAVAVVLLIVCANLAGLLLVRALRRRRETAVRVALGAPIVTLLRQTVLESLLISLAGVFFGTLLAAVGIRFGLGLLPASLPLVHQIDISWTVLAFGLLLALVTGGLCGIAPAFATIYRNMNETLKESGRMGTTGSGHAQLRSTLVVSEVAVAFALMAASGLLLRSFVKMGDESLGYEPSHILSAAYSLPWAAYRSQAAIDNFNHTVVMRLRSLPDVRYVGLSSFLPDAGSDSNNAFVAEGYTQPQGVSLDLATNSDVQADYFRAMGIPLLRGRYLTPEDTGHAQLVAVVNQHLAEQSWPGQSPIGKRLRFGVSSMSTPWITVVGEVANVKESSPDAPDRQQYYVPLAQQNADYGSFGGPGNLNGSNEFIVLRTTLPPTLMENALRATIRSIDPQLALDHVQTMAEALSSVEAPRRFDTTLISVFAAAALLLALLGIYSILAFSAALRAQEMAIRLALGSQRADVVRLILVSGAKLAAVGCAVGLALAVAGEKLIASLLFGVSATDPIILSAAALAIFLLTLAVSLLPARRAASVNPVDAMRAQ